MSMGSLRRLVLSSLAILPLLSGCRSLATPHPLLGRRDNTTLITQDLFWELEELSRVVDISYCVGTAGLGIQKPFKCLSHCGDKDFQSFELVKVSNRLQRCAACEAHD